MAAAALLLAFAAHTADAFGVQVLGQYKGVSSALRDFRAATSAVRTPLTPALRMKEDGEATKVRHIRGYGAWFYASCRCLASGQASFGLQAAYVALRPVMQPLAMPTTSACIARIRHALFAVRTAIPSALLLPLTCRACLPMSAER